MWVLGSFSHPGKPCWDRAPGTGNPTPGTGHRPQPPPRGSAVRSCSGEANPGVSQPRLPCRKSCPEKNATSHGQRLEKSRVAGFLLVPPPGLGSPRVPPAPGNGKTGEIFALRLWQPLKTSNGQILRRRNPQLEETSERRKKKRF